MAALRRALGDITGFDVCLSAVCNRPRHSSPQTQQAAIRNVLRIRTNLGVCARLVSVLRAAAGAEDELLDAVAGALGSDGADAIVGVLDHVLEEDAAAARSGVEMRQNECFAIRAGLNPDLDVVRQLYVKNVEDAAALADECRDACEHGPGRAR